MATHHADAAACCDRLRQIARILDTAVCDDRNAVLFGNCIAVHNSGDLRNTDTCYDTGRTDGTRSDTNLDRVNACLDRELLLPLRSLRYLLLPADPDMLP